MSKLELWKAIFLVLELMIGSLTPSLFKTTCFTRERINIRMCDSCNLSSTSHFLVLYVPTLSNRQSTMNFILLLDLGVLLSAVSKNNFHLENFNTECCLRQTMLHSSLNPKELTQDHLNSAQSESLLYHIANYYYSNLMQNESSVTSKQCSI